VAKIRYKNYYNTQLKCTDIYKLLSSSYECVTYLHTYQIYAQQIMLSFASLKIKVNRSIIKLNGVNYVVVSGFLKIIQFLSNL